MERTLDLLDLIFIEYFVNDKCKVKYYMIFHDNPEEIVENVKKEIRERLEEIAGLIKTIYGDYKKYIVGLFKMKDGILVMIGNSKKIIKDVVDMLNSERKEETDRKLGELFGFPKCCIDKYLEDVSNNVIPVARYAEQVKNSGIPILQLDGDKELLFLHPLIILRKVNGGKYQYLGGAVSHIPCSPTCSETLLLLSKILSVGYTLLKMREGGIDDGGRKGKLGRNK